MQHSNTDSCILLKFYIKPQPILLRVLRLAVVSYWNSTSNHNFLFCYTDTWQVVSYWNSTSNHNTDSIGVFSSVLYLIEILHQTTTDVSRVKNHSSCILLKFYIKPQQQKQSQHRTVSCILLKFYIKPQRMPSYMILYAVVSYWNSTSNHNLRPCLVASDALYLIEILHQTTTNFASLLRRSSLYLIEILHQTTTTSVDSKLTLKLYLIEILHQTTTRALCRRWSPLLYLIEILHQTTTIASMYRKRCCCILLKFYIKPQLMVWTAIILVRCILLKFYIKPQQQRYLDWSSNCCILLKFYIKPQRSRGHRSRTAVVSYWNSTSNHNSGGAPVSPAAVVSYWNSTSNHNSCSRYQ